MSLSSQVLILVLLILPSIHALSRNFYADPLSQSTIATGAIDNPWVTLDQISSACSQLLPGDTVFLRSDRVYTGKLTISCSGSSSAPIVFTSYGTGAMPEFDNTLAHIIRLNNTRYVVIDGFKIIDRSVHATDHTQLAHTTYAIVLENSQHCIIKNCDISLVGIGISISGNSTGSIVDNNRIYNLRMLRNTIGGNDDFGATAIVLACSNITVTKNHFEDCWGTSHDYLYEGGTVELFGDTVSNNLIAYNTAINNNGFVKVGSISNGLSVDNIFAYNKIVNCGYLAILQDTGLYRTRIRNIQFYNNTIIETQQQLRKPTAVFWMNGDGTAGMITVKNNIFWLSSGINVTPTKFDNGQLIHTHNIYRLSQGAVGLSLHASEFYSPLAKIFTTTSGNPSNWNYTLARGSAAIDFGTPVGFTQDFDGISIVDRPDAGAFEYDMPIIMAAIQAGRCYGDSSIINIQAKGGVPPYSGIGTFSVLTGTRNFSVADARGKRDSVTVIINGTSAMIIAASVTPASAINPTSTINVLSSGGTPPYTYQLDQLNYQSSASFLGVVPGSYLLTVKDANGCLTTQNVEVSSYEKLSFTPEQGSRFKVFPNPSNYYFNLNNLMYTSSSTIQLDVYNVKGILVHSVSGKFNDLVTFGHHLSQGTYTIRIQVDSFVQTLSVIKL